MIRDVIPSCAATLRFAALVPATLLGAGTASALPIQVDVTAVTANTFISSGDPCATGTTGIGACNGLPIVMQFIIETDDAPADSDPATQHSLYRDNEPPGFIVASATINGQLFSMPGSFTFNFDHSVEIYDDVTISMQSYDRVLLGVSGGNAGAAAALSANINRAAVINGNGTAGENLVLTANLLLLPDSFTGDGFGALTQIQGSPLAGTDSNGGFNVTNATGSVLGQFEVTSIAVTAIPAPPVAWLVVATFVTLAGRARRRR
jgi:hypothetical protein